MQEKATTDGIAILSDALYVTHSNAIVKSLMKSSFFVRCSRDWNGAVKLYAITLSELILPAAPSGANE